MGRGSPWARGYTQHPWAAQGTEPARNPRVRSRPNAVVGTSGSPVAERYGGGVRLVGRGSWRVPSTRAPRAAARASVRVGAGSIRFSETRGAAANVISGTGSATANVISGTGTGTGTFTGEIAPLTPPRSGCRGRALILGRKQSACGLKPASPQARSSVVEHYLDTVGVGSSILPAPTKAAVSGQDALARVRGNRPEHSS
jgi:hypothetical protein